MSLLTDLISFWKLDESSGTRYDSHGSNDLTDNNTVGSTTGVVGNAAEFAPGSAEYLSVASNSGLQIPDVEAAFSVWFMIYTSPGGASFVIVSKNKSGPDMLEYAIDYLTSTSKMRFFFYNGTTPYIVSSTATVAFNVWHHLVAWHDPTANTINLQLDGAAVDSASTSGAAPNTDAAPFQIGGQEYSGFEGYMNGLIDEVYYRKGSLPTADERIWLYAKTPYDLFGDSSAELTVSSSGDEASVTSSGGYSTSPTNITVGAGIYDYAGLWRFSGLSAAKGNTITKAFLVLFADAPYDTTGYSMSIDAEDSDGASIPFDYSDYTSRTFTTAVATGDLGNMPDGLVSISLDCTDVIQELADRSGWTGVALMRLQSTSSVIGLRTATNGYYARLFVRWQAAAPPAFSPWWAYRTHRTIGGGLI